MTRRLGAFQLGERLVIPRVWRAESFMERAIGLMGQKPLPAGEALLITRCRSIHTIGMRFPLDVLFMDEVGRVARVVRGLRAWRCAAAPRPACQVLEARSGWLPEECLRVGARLSWVGPK